MSQSVSLLSAGHLPSNELDSKRNMPLNLADDSLLGQNPGEIGRARATLGYIDRWASARATEGGELPHRPAHNPRPQHPTSTTFTHLAHTLRFSFTDAHRSAVLAARQTSYPRNREEAVNLFALPAELKGTFTNPNYLGFSDISARISEYEREGSVSSVLGLSPVRAQSYRSSCYQRHAHANSTLLLLLLTGEQQVKRDQALRTYRTQIENGTAPEEERFFKFSPRSPRHKTSLVLPCSRNVKFFDMAKLPSIDADRKVKRPTRPNSRTSTARSTYSRKSFAPSTYSTRSDRIDELEAALATERSKKQQTIAEIANLTAQLTSRQ